MQPDSLLADKYWRVTNPPILMQEVYYKKCFLDMQDRMKDDQKNLCTRVLRAMVG